jgi:hypothetical protein
LSSAMLKVVREGFLLVIKTKRSNHRDQCTSSQNPKDPPPGQLIVEGIHLYINIAWHRTW